MCLTLRSFLAWSISYDLSEFTSNSSRICLMKQLIDAAEFKVISSSTLPSSGGCYAMNFTITDRIMYRSCCLKHNILASLLPGVAGGMRPQIFAA